MLSSDAVSERKVFYINRIKKIMDHGDELNSGTVKYENEVGSLAHPASYPVGIRDSFPGVKASGREADHHLHLVPRSRKRGALSLLPQYIFMAWCLVQLSDSFTFALCNYRMSSLSTGIGGIALGYGLHRGFESRQGLGNFLFTTTSRLA
jgi:hypothetical protein